MSTTSGWASFTQAHGRGAAVPLRHELDVVEEPQDRLEPSADQGVIVGDDDPDPLGRFFPSLSHPWPPQRRTTRS